MMIENENLLKKNFSGVISISKDGEKILQKAYGLADKSNKVENSTETKFATASAGKAFVATAILKLIEENYITYDTTIKEILKFDLKNIDPNITVRQLLNHTSGIPDYFDESQMDDYEELWADFPNYKIRKSSDLIPLFINKPMMYKRGEKFQYNNTGYVVLGLIIEEITKMPFDKYLSEVIFKPCKMDNTGYYELDRLPSKCAFSYLYDAKRKEYRTNIYSVDAKGSGAGGAFTTCEDVGKFWASLMSGKIISKKFVKDMTSPQINKGYYGYGLWLLNGEIPSFQGCDPGVNFITSYNLKTNSIVTILSNIDYDVETLHDEIYSQFNL